MNNMLFYTCFRIDNFNFVQFSEISAHIMEQGV